MSAGKHQKRRAHRLGGRPRKRSPREKQPAEPATPEVEPEAKRPGSLTQALNDLSLDDLIAIGAAGVGAVQSRKPK